MHSHLYNLKGELKMKANLHVHSNYSDGTKTIKEINELAIKDHFNYVAITDHDTVDSIDEINKLKTNVKFIMGVEMSVKYENEIIHILGYFKDNVSSDVKTFFDNEKSKLEKRIKQILTNLKTYYNLEITYDDVKKRADGIINSAHVASALVDKYGFDFQEVYDKFLGHDKKGYVSNECISLEDGIRFLHANKALVVLAHPILIHKFDYHKILDLGFDGLEIFHPNQDEEYRLNLIKEAKEHHLLITGGSDYHGDLLAFKFDEAYLENEEDINKFINELNKKSGN